MNLLRLTRSALSGLFNRNSKIQNQKSFDPSAWLRGEDLDSTPALQNAYQQVVWVYRAINVLAEQVANIPFRFSVGEPGRENLITSGPLIDLYARPHPHINRFQYWELRVIWLLLRGECVRIPIYQNTVGTSSTSSPSSLPPSSGSPRALDSGPPLPDSGSPRPIRWGEGSGVRGTSDSALCTPHSALGQPRRTLKKILILDPAQFQHIVQDHELLGWRYTGFSRETPLESQVFLPEEVWFEKLPNPFDFWRGLPPLYVANLAAQTDYAAASFMRGIMENNGDLGLIVRTAGQLDATQREQIQAALRNRKRRAGTGDSLLLSNTAEIVRPTLSSADLQFLENRKFSRSEICAAFGVPEEIVTITDNTKYDVMSGSRLNFIENRVAPLCARLEAEEERTVKAIDPEATGWFDLDSLPIMQQARRNRLAAAKTGFDMGIPFNELNQVFDLGFKPLPWGNKGHLPANLQPAGELPPEPPVQSSKFNVQGSRLSPPNLPASLQSLLESLRTRHPVEARFQRAGEGGFQPPVPLKSAIQNQNSKI